MVAVERESAVGGGVLRVLHPLYEFLASPPPPPCTETGVPIIVGFRIGVSISFTVSVFSLSLGCSVL